MINTIITILFFLIPILYLKFVKQKSILEALKELIPKSQGWKKELIGSFALFGALFLGFILLTTAMSFFEAGTGIIVNDLDKVGDIVASEVAFNSIAFIFSMVIIVFLEEFFFRSFLVPRIGMILSTIIFTIFHYGYGSIAELTGVFLLGLILAYWFKKKKSLIQNYFGHLFYNVLAVIIYLLL